MSAILDSFRQLEAEEAHVMSDHPEPSGGNSTSTSRYPENGDVIAALECSVSEWSSQAEDAYAVLAERIGRLQERISVESVAAASRDSESERAMEAALEAAETRSNALAREVSEREEELAAATQRIAQLKDEVAAFTAEALRLQQALDEKTAINRQQEDDLARVRVVLSNARDQLTAARSLSGKAEEFKTLFDAERQRASRLEEQYREKETEASAAIQQAKILQERLDELAQESRKEVAALKSESNALRRMNACLTLPGAPLPPGLWQEAEEGKAPEGYRPRMGDMLVDLGAITEDQLSTALREQEATPHRRIGSILVEFGFVPEESISRVLARQLNLPFVKLAPEVVDASAPHLINGQLAKRRQCIPITATSDRVVLAMANPQDLITLDDVKLSSGRTVSPVVATGTDITAAIGRYYGLS